MTAPLVPQQAVKPINFGAVATPGLANTPATFGQTPVPAPALIPGASTPSIVPGTSTDLRGTSVLPGQDPRLATTQAQVGQLAGQVAGGPATITAQDPNDQFTKLATSLLQRASVPSGGVGLSFASAGQDSAETARLKQLVADLSGNLSGPDRSTLASQAFDLLQQQSDPRFQQDLRDVTRLNAAFGRQGSGITTNQLGDVTALRNRDLAQAQQALALDAAGQTLQDRLNVLSGAGNAFGQLSNADLQRAGLGIQAAGVNNQGALGAANLALQGRGLDANLASQAFGLGSALRGENRLDQDRSFGANLSGLGALSGLESQQFGQGLTGRNELRTERGFQTDQSQQAIQNNLAQATLEDNLQNSALNRNATLAQLLNQLGQQNNPTNPLLIQSNQIATQAAAQQKSVNDLLQEFFRRQASTGATGGVATQPATGAGVGLGPITNQPTFG